MEKLQQELVEANAQKSKALNDLHLAKEALSTTEARAHATHVRGYDSDYLRVHLRQ